MKNRRLKLLSAVIVAILLLTAFFVACDKKPPQSAHTHEFKEVGGAAKKCDCGETLAYTDEENFAYWNIGRKHSLNYDGAYTSAATGTSTETSGKDVSSYADAVLETADGNKLLRTNRTHAIGADGKTDESKVTEGDDICIKIVDDNGVSRKYAWNTTMAKLPAKEVGFVRLKQARKRCTIPRKGFAPSLSTSTTRHSPNLSARQKHFMSLRQPRTSRLR